MTDDPILTIRIPRSSWLGILNGIEKWTGRSRWDDVEILSDYEILAPLEYREVAAEKVAEYAAELAAEDDDTDT